MKKLFLSLFSILAVSVWGQTLEQTIYIDFGENNVSSRGNLTTGADANGHYWTNVYSSPSERLYPTDWQLVNSENTTTGYTLQVGTYFHTNGISGGGGLQNPSSDLLGDLAVATATQDYIHVETFQDYNVLRFTGLDPEKAYRFNCFGSRVVAEERGGYLEFCGENEWSEYMQNSGSGLGADNYNGNNNHILVTAPIFPRANGEITIVFNKKFKGGMMYLNCMKVEELSGLERPNKELSLTQKFFVDFGETSNAERGHTTTTDSNGNWWNNMSSGSSTSNNIAAGKSITLRNTAKKTTLFKLRTESALTTNGLNNGGYNNPSVENLGELAIATATEDYVWVNDDNTRVLTFTGLDTQKCYRFTVFGSRSTSEGDRRYSVYTFTGLTTWKQGTATSGQFVGGADYHGNVRNLVISDYIFPDADGNITFSVNRTQTPKSDFAHFNLIRMEEYSGGTRPSEPVRVTSPFISGTATETGADVPFTELKPGGVSAGVYELYQQLQPGTYNLCGTLNGATVSLGIDNAGQLVVDGPAFTVEQQQVVRLRYDSRKGALTITPVTLHLRGNICPGNPTVAYKGNGVFEQEVTMDDSSVFLFSDKSFYFAFNNTDALAVKRLSGSRTAVGMPSEGFSADNIRMNGGTYTITLDMTNYKWNVSAPIDGFKISAFGSSVCNGQGATDMKGYAYLYGQQCNQRYKRHKSDYPFAVSGVSIGGNTTINLLDRYDEMIHDFGKYVIIGLSMGNEGIHGASDPNAIYNQFRDNMLKLIDMMHADGKTVVVMNNYTRGDYNSTDYSYVKNMNLLIHQWDVPSVNVLGAIDNGAGKWADGYEADTYHPTTEGHQQFMYAIPTSLFDALEQGKPLPVRDTEQSTVLKNGSTIKFEGESVVNPFTVSVRVKGQEEGKVLTFTTASGSGVITILADGHVEYTSPLGTTSTSTRQLIKNADDWYDITITHYYAQKRTLVYVNRSVVCEVSERLVPTGFVVGDESRRLSRAYSELTFWRSAMTATEISQWYSGKMLKSSLDIYSPLGSSIATQGISNLAQSLNAATYVPGTLVLGDANSDGSVTMNDANLITNYYVTDGGVVINTALADVNADDLITMTDANGVVNIFVNE